MLCCGRFALAGDAPFFVDLSRAANAGLEDDGIRDNGKGGWTDEGVNDMYVWPPLPLGTNTYNGYPFHVIDPAGNEGRSAVILQGLVRCQDKPLEATADVPHVTGRYVFFMQHSSASVDAEQHHRVATYTVTYADGTEAEVPMRDGLEIRNWWTGLRGSDHREALRWPVHYGVNLYTQKWRNKIGVWATRWENPHPDKPITSIRFRSEGKSAPIIFAVTISDVDYSEQRQEPPPMGPVPEGYFAGKAALENAGLFRAMVDGGHIEGIRDLQVIRADLLGVTVDAALTRSGIGYVGARDHQTPEGFTMSSETDPAYAGGRHPVQVGRFSYERWNGDIGAYPGNLIYWHEYYLLLPEPLESGHRYSVAVEGIDEPFVSVRMLEYDDASTTTKAIKVNQVGYSARSERRYAYLGWWAGDMGAVDYSGLRRFEVVDERDGAVALTGDIVPRRAADPLSGEEVHEMDLSPLGPGTYHVRVPGLARSDTFHVGGASLRDLYFHTMRAFFHQRCGQELREPWTWVRKEACHVWCWESGYLVEESYEPGPGEQKRAFRGGYHDAADFDHFTYHLPATAQILTMYEQCPDAFKDGDLNIPEGGNGVPDVLDEANWGLSFYRENQREDGGVPLGRGNGCDAFAQQTGGSRTPFGVLPVRRSSCLEFAATAAQFARVYESFDSGTANAYLDGARRAYEWAAAHREGSRRGRRLDAWAAAELFCATGEQRYNDEFKHLFASGALDMRDRVLDQHWPVYAWPYVRCTRDGADSEIQQRLAAMFVEKGDALLESTERPAYRMGHGGQTYLGWGTGNGGGHYADPCLRAYWLTGRRQYLDAACLNADFQLGCNPLSKCFITGMGIRPPLRPEISWFLYDGRGLDARTVEGITVYGLSEQIAFDWYPSDLPAWRKWRDLWGAGSETCSEFTIPQTIGPAAMLYGSLYAMEGQRARLHGSASIRPACRAASSSSALSASGREPAPCILSRATTSISW
jgi:endoglucanase